MKKIKWIDFDFIPHYNQKEIIRTRYNVDKVGGD